MAEIQTLIAEQQEAHGQLLKVWVNYTKLAKEKRTKVALQGRLERLEVLWQECSERHRMIFRQSDEKNRKELSYYANNTYDRMIESYDDVRDNLRSTLADFSVPETQAVADQKSATTTPRSELIDLPPIKIKPFSGELSDWMEFRDLFLSLVDKRQDLGKVQKLHHLKSNVRGEASKLLEDISVTEAHYDEAWELLLKRYEDPLAILRAYLDKFLALPNVGSNKKDDLKRLRDESFSIYRKVKALGRAEQLGEDLYIHIMLDKLDEQTRQTWEATQIELCRFPTLSEVDDFLSQQIRIVRPASNPAVRQVKPSRPSTTKHTRPVNFQALQASAYHTCSVCSSNHPLYQCSEFKSRSVAQRYAILVEQQRCINCFRQGHHARDCKSANSCRYCQKRHNTLLHTDAKSKNSNPEDGGLSQHPGDRNVVVHFAGIRKDAVILPTAVVIIRSESGRACRVRVLFDQGSQATFISESLCQLLRPRRRHVLVTVTGICEGRAVPVKGETTILVSPHSNPSLSYELAAYILPALSKYTPPPEINPSEFPHLRSLALADPYVPNQEPIDLVIGANYFGSFLRHGLVHGPKDTPIAQLTTFGWIVSGCATGKETKLPPIFSHNITFERELLNAVLKFWEVEEAPSFSAPRAEDELCEQHFVATHSRLPCGRYMVSLPFKGEPPLDLGNTFASARQLFLKQESRLLRDPNLRSAYTSFLDEYLDLGHMEEVPISESHNKDNTYYLPHHPVVKPTSITTKVRVVFNASFKSSNNTSLNDHLHVGPKLQVDLCTLILRWRQFRYVLSTDLEKMFRQIRVTHSDADYQRILWRRSAEEEIKSYRLKTVTYGTACAPFLANRVLRQLAHDERTKFPRGASVLLENVYVDDVMFGANDPDSLIEIREEVINLLTAGGFSCHKWATNFPALLKNIPDQSVDNCNPRHLGEDSEIKILGILWEPSRDAFRFQVKECPLIETKRTFLSFIAKFFDPMGWATPAIISAKILMQTLWLRKVSWDEKLPADLMTQCHLLQNQSKTLNQVSIPRWTGQCLPLQNLQLHAFCDASNQAYAACVYLRFSNEEGHLHTALLFAKSKVAPLKLLSIPRLELCGAVLLVRILRFVVETLGLPEAPVYCWTDSTVVLSWLKAHPSRWKVFVANRISKIQNAFPNAHWRYVPSEQNPADYASRGINPNQLQHHPLWWTGPAWLSRPPTKWPSNISLCSTEDVVPPDELQAMTVQISSDFDLTTRVSSWQKVLRVMSYILRFTSYSRGKKPRADNTRISCSELEVAKTTLCKMIQSIYFPDAYRRFLNGDRKNPEKGLLPLNPFMDTDGVIRLGGRLRNTPLQDHNKYPIVLPDCPMSRLIIQFYHTRSLHGGLQVTLRMLRETFWVFNARSLTKQCIRQCVTCAKYRAATLTQQMGNLPAPRVTPSRPFSHCGIDYAGPFSIRTSKGRGQKSHKGYCVIFICLAVRAIHLECASDCSTATFLAALDRFVSRRGLPYKIYSDNGPNFVGADRELSANLSRLLRDPSLHDHLAKDGISWEFIPPASPHFGGLWEAGVKSVKHHLRRVMGNFMPTVEEFNTLLCKIEAVLNSRPLSPLHDDPDEFDVLTPGHFLTGSALKSVPTPSLLSVDDNRLTRWQALQKMQEAFWRIWSLDYLNSLQLRRKWKNQEDNLSEGNLVMIKNPNLPPGKWELGRVIKTLPGQDGLTRVVRVRTSRSTFTRPITQLCKLPVCPPNTS